MDIEEAVEMALSAMPEDSVLKAFLLSNKAEVKRMCITEYNEAKVFSQQRDEGIAEGLAEGLAKGMEKGLAQGIEKGKKEGISEGLAKKEAELIAKWKSQGMTDQQIQNLLN